MLAVAQIDDELLFCPRIKTEISLVREVLDVEQYFHERRFGHEYLRLFAFTTKHSWLLAVGDVRLGIAVHYLERIMTVRITAMLENIMYRDRFL